MDGRVWKNYEFVYKLNDVNQTLRQAAPHQPRLDWQMWFSALRGTYSNQGWLPYFILRLLEGEKTVIKLLKNAPYNDRPRFIRASLIHYEFQTNKTKGSVWKKIGEKQFLGPVELAVKRK